MVSRSTIAGYESIGRQPSFNLLSKIVEYFNVSTDYLFGNEKDIEKEGSQYEKELSTLLSDPELIIAFEDYGFLIF